jgi:hypothetical protein
VIYFFSFQLFYSKCDNSFCDLNFASGAELIANARVQLSTK